MPVRTLHPDLAEKARAELNEDPKRLTNDLQFIKDWIAKQPHLRARTDDQWLVAFLRGCKFSLERVKQKLEVYYAVRSTAPDLYRINHRHPKFEEILDLGSFVFLPKSTDLKMPKIAIIRPGAYDPSRYTVSDILSVALILKKVIDVFVISTVLIRQLIPIQYSKASWKRSISEINASL